MSADVDLVTVLETDRREKIALAEYALRAAGIPFTAANDIVSVFYPVDGMAVVRFQVLEEDAEDARAVVEGLEFGPSRLSRPPERAGGRRTVVLWGRAGLSLALSISASEALARLGSALGEPGCPVRGSVESDAFRIRPRWHWLLPLAIRGRAVARGSGCELQCRLDFGHVRRLGILVVAVGAVAYVVESALTAASAGHAGTVRVLVPVLPVCTVGLVLAVAGLLLTGRQAGHLEAFLLDLFEDVVLDRTGSGPDGGRELR